MSIDDPGRKCLTWRECRGGPSCEVFVRLCGTRLHLKNRVHFFAMEGDFSF